MSMYCYCYVPWPTHVEESVRASAQCAAQVSPNEIFDPLLPYPLMLIRTCPHLHPAKASTTTQCCSPCMHTLG